MQVQRQNYKQVNSAETQKIFLHFKLFKMELVTELSTTGSMKQSLDMKNQVTKIPAHVEAHEKLDLSLSPTLP